MKNLQNKKFIHFKKDNEKKIKCDLRGDMINDLIVCGYTTICRGDKVFTIQQLDYSFYSYSELDELKELNIPYVQILQSNNDSENIYVTEGTLLDQYENELSITLNEALDRFVDLVVCNDYTSPTGKSVCRVYDYYLSQELFKDR